MKNLLTKKFHNDFISFGLLFIMFFAFVFTITSIIDSKKELYIHNSYLHNSYVVSYDKKLYLFSSILYQAK